MTANPTVVLDGEAMRRTLVRIAHEIVERNPADGELAAPGDATPPGEPAALADAIASGEPAPPAEQPAAADDLALVGIHRRGAILARRLHALTSELLDADVPLGELDIAFYRDDLGIRPSAPVVHSTQLDFPLDGRTVVIVDDVLYTGRTVRAAIDAIFDYGRPARIQLAVMVDRGHRELPIRPDYVGKNLPTSRRQRVNVRVRELDGVDEVSVGPALERVAMATGGERT
jgi:pyrimidine operon attenuation protein/uracil phosphoribosyltransferase